MEFGKDIGKFFRRLKRYDRRYFRNKYYDFLLRKVVESRLASARLGKKYPELSGKFRREWAGARERLLPHYEDYVSGVSSDIMAASLEVSVLLLLCCEIFRPMRILDLGSGFSSFVFRFYMGTANPKPTVVSVDDSDEWLEKTGSYLKGKNVCTDNLIPWGDFAGMSMDPFDLVFYDLGGFEFRKDTFVKVTRMVSRGGVLIIDDMHSADYGSFVKEKMDAENMRYYSVREHTNDRFGRFSFIAHHDHELSSRVPKG